MRAVLAALSIALLATASASAQTNATPVLYVNSSYDPAASPTADLRRAMAHASRRNTRVLIVVGGDWCVWCEILDRFIAQDANVRAEFVRSFVIVKVNWSRENENEEFLGRYPTPAGYPDFIILSADGSFAGRQNTAELERGRSYDPASMIAFARRWRPND
jgi:thioredoxin-related protein